MVLKLAEFPESKQIPYFFIYCFIANLRTNELIDKAFDYAYKKYWIFYDQLIESGDNIIHSLCKHFGTERMSDSEYVIREKKLGYPVIYSPDFYYTIYDPTVGIADNFLITNEKNFLITNEKNFLITNNEKNFLITNNEKNFLITNNEKNFLITNDDDSYYIKRDRKNFHEYTTVGKSTEFSTALEKLGEKLGVYIDPNVNYEFKPIPKCNYGRAGNIVYTAYYSSNAHRAGICHHKYGDEECILADQVSGGQWHIVYIEDPSMSDGYYPYCA
ncbi:hypothetical protein GPJ56_003409 [Histomonas meleagridis]|uniref:uncharacterized protein n=1 Tax=Histomonas meleagridis TaxID=135588 RepID=UPI00355AA7D6|nr:hypothetical protein GPJ56_003409 [Histomonas meleagridis]KAH0799100.1 hypothetical protein GO595_007897 [Histomonas meleagridis]